MAEVIRCSECGTVFKGVPSWLVTARVNFACTSCPKKGTRGTLTRYEPVVETRSTIDLDTDLDDVDIDGLDDDVDIDLGDDLEALGDDKDL
ncbi:MAG: hypothetical protein ACLQVD_18255 [Capsulimonadaceae bacterium]